MNHTTELLDFKFHIDEFVHLVPQPQENTGAINILNEIIEKHGRRQSKPLPDVGEVYRKFMNAAPDGIDASRRPFDSVDQEGRFARRLARALSYFESSPPHNVPIIQTRFLPLALQLICEHFDVTRRCFQVRILLTLFDTLLKNWSSSGASQIMEFIKEKIFLVGNKRKRVLNIQKKAEWYLNERGPSLLAATLLDEGQRLSSVWEYLHFPEYMHSYEYFGAVAVQYVNILLSRGLMVEDIDDIIRFLELHNNKKTDKKILSEIISKHGSKVSYNYRDALKSYALNSLGDPTILGNWHPWENASEDEKATLEKARQTFSGWLIQEFIQLFFEAASDPYRKAFWLGYAGHINSFKVAGGIYTRHHLLQDERLGDILRGRFATLEEGVGEGQAAFIFKIKNYTFVEFFKKGAALYAFPDTNPLAPKMDKQSYSMSELCHADIPYLVKRSEYYNDWQYRLKEWMKDKLDIPPRTGLRR